MFREILVPVDLSERNRLAFAALDGLAAPGASVELLHVVEHISGIAEPEFDAFYETLERKARALLAGWAEELRAQGRQASVRVCVGHRGAEIVRRARERKCDLILMASHPVSGPDSRLGTLSHQIAMVAPCSVLLVR